MAGLVEQRNKDKKASGPSGACCAAQKHAVARRKRRRGEQKRKKWQGAFSEQHNKPAEAHARSSAFFQLTKQV